MSDWIGQLEQKIRDYRRHSRYLLIALIWSLMWLPNPVSAVVQFQKAFIAEHLDRHPDQAFAKFAKRKARCHICHQGKGNKHNNVYGTQLAKLLDHKKDKKDTAKIVVAIRKVAKLPFDPSDKAGETFADRIAASQLPGGILDELKKQPQLTAVNLFDGKTLDGWIGSTDAYEVRDGLLASLPGKSGNLYTKEEYSDFVLRFEFRLTPGANNGIGIRTPLQGDAAYVGIELQVLDNSAEMYADLKPYQFHGSAYGIAAARRGHLKTVGEWNSQEVRCSARQITVILNGETILDTNLDEAAHGRKTLDGQAHPGRVRRTGHIGLLGHGSVVEYRSLKIQDFATIEENTPETSAKLR